MTEMQKSYYATKSFINNIDWEKLRVQYHWLIEKFADADGGGNYAEEREPADGLLELLYAVKTLAVEHFGVAEADAFFLATEDEE